MNDQPETWRSEPSEFAPTDHEPIAVALPPGFDVLLAEYPSEHEIRLAYAAGGW